MVIRAVSNSHGLIPPPPPNNVGFFSQPCQCTEKGFLQSIDWNNFKQTSRTSWQRCSFEVPEIEAPTIYKEYCKRYVGRYDMHPKAWLYMVQSHRAPPLPLISHNMGKPRIRRPAHVITVLRSTVARRKKTPVGHGMIWLPSAIPLPL